jgi:hypothetical protein
MNRGVKPKRFHVRIKSDASIYPFEGQRKTTTHTTVRFPSQCSKCLGTRDLTFYTTKWKHTYYGARTKVTQKAKINVPICRSCLNSLKSGVRASYERRLAISGPIWLVALLLALTFKSLELSLIIAVLGIVPILFLCYIIIPKERINWPVKLMGQNDFSFENETYAKMFASANGVSL